MSHGNLENGLYLLVQKSEEKGVDHYGILDVGNRMNAPDVSGDHPVVVHQTPPIVRRDWLQNTGSWRILGRITEEVHALHRMRIALSTPRYNLFGNNCEHFARYIATGRRESMQVQSTVVTVGLAALAIAALSKKAA